ncbi:unnamed protein product [Caretta caretta]
MLSIFWFNSRETDFSACLTQLYFIQCFSGLDSGVFMAMALICCMAICDHIRYCTTLTNPVLAIIGLAVVLCGSMLMLPYPFLARWWPYCRTNIISNSFCEHVAILKLACTDIRISTHYGLFVAFFLTSLAMYPIP